MAVMNQILSEAATIVARANDTASTTTSAASPPATTTDNSDGGNKGNGSSPLLFFVALGFGVVFTNLWIIVGVKYCFRYNARNRARMMNEDGEPINLDTMPRPHRRRREKKLMTMDEVNEKFPMMKYKSWVSERAREGLPTAGGVSVPASRANSLREADGIVGDLAAKERHSTTEPVVEPPTAEANRAPDEHPATSEETKAASDSPTDVGQTSGQATSRPQELQRVTSDQDDEDEHIDAALPPECMAAPGDSCAICIDTLEDDDDVRGLACGHCFHAVCVDPWLTSRRACCPLCKADYYVPKPRPNADGDPNNPNSNAAGLRPEGRFDLPSWFRGAGHGNSAFRRTPVQSRRNRGGRQVGNEDQGASQNNDGSSPDTNTQAAQQDSTPEVTEQPGNGVLSSIRQTFGFGRRRNGNNGSNEESNSAPPANEPVTPSQLESGSRPAATA